MDDKTKKAMETAQKAADAVDKGVNWTDEKVLSKIPEAAGSQKPKLMVAVTVVLILAIVRDATIAILLAAVMAILNMKLIVAFLKMQMEKKDQKPKVEQKAAVVVIEKKEDEKL